VRMESVPCLNVGDPVEKLENRTCKNDRAGYHTMERPQKRSLGCYTTIKLTVEKKNLKENGCGDEKKKGGQTGKGINTESQVAPKKKKRGKPPNPKSKGGKRNGEGVSVK